MRILIKVLVLGCVIVLTGLKIDTACYGFS